MNDNHNLVTIVLAAGAGLASAVGVLFRIVMKQSDEQTKMSCRVGHLEGKQEGVVKLSEEVLQTVHNAIGGSRGRDNPKNLK